MRSRSNRKAQSTMEYIIVLTAIATILAYAALNWIKPASQKSLEEGGTAIKNASKRVADIIKTK